MTYNFALLELARHLRGITQKDAAEAIGISQGQLSKAEGMLRSLPDSCMNKVSEVYGMPLSFFMRNVSENDLGVFSFRRRATVPDKKADQIIAEATILRIILDEFLEPIELPDYSLDSYDTDELTPAEIARDVRKKLGILRGPIPDLITLLERNGIIIFKYQLDSSKVDALSGTTLKGRPIILLNSSWPNDRIRFSLAHELGHIVMHSDMRVVTESSTMETQADEFASEFLLPSYEIKPFLYNLNLVTLYELKRRWKVSMRAIIRKSKDLGCIDNNKYRNWQISFSKKGYNVHEPFPLPLESPTAIRKIVDLYKNELGYSDTEIMNLLTLNKEEYYRWFSSSDKLIKPVDFSH